MQAQQVVNQTEGYMAKFKGRYSDWYAGIAADPKQRLFNDHGVDEKYDAWVYHHCGTDDLARAIEHYFLDKGCKGGPGGGDEATHFFYAYKTAPHTRE